MQAERREPLWRMVVLAAVLGSSFTLALTHTWAWPLSMLALWGLIAALDGVQPRSAFLIGWVFHTAWIFSATWWLVISMHRYGGLLLPLAVAAALALAMALALYGALACSAWVRWRSGRAWLDALLLALMWWLAEWARATLLTGFPWGASGYTQVDGPLAALAPWVGVYGIGAVMVALVAAVAIRRGAWWRRAAPLLMLVVVPLVARVDFTTPTRTLTATLIQTNVEQNMKFDMSLVPRHLADLRAALTKARGTLVLAPETAIPLPPLELGAANMAALREPFASAPDVPWNATRGALVGLPLGDFERGYTNSVTGLGGDPTPNGQPYRYDKHHLVPFGELVPPGFRWFVDAMKIPLGDFVRGPVGARSFHVAGERVAPNICYEDLFGEELAQRYGPKGDAPTIHANVSNIAWFGDTIAIDHHLNIARMRAMEMQRPMLRATNTGATAAIDHLGRVTATMPPFVAGSLDVEVTGREGLTPYVRAVAATGGLGAFAAAAALLIALQVLLARGRVAAPAPVDR